MTNEQIERAKADAEDRWRLRRNAVETAKSALEAAVAQLSEVQKIGHMSSDDARALAVAKTNIQTGQLWLNEIKE